MKICFQFKNLSLYFLSIIKCLFALGIFIEIFTMLHVTNVNADLFTATAYCSCRECCDKDSSDEWYGITATGTRAKWGTVAVDKEIIELGTFLVIEGFPDAVFRAEDVGGAIEGKRIDIWFPSHREALAFGVQKKEVFCFDEFVLRVLDSPRLMSAMGAGEGIQMENAARY
ncbi:MAG: 3D domain-containing protein [Candidatus Scalindua sp.]|nr:3D domain-containing protein [Candidatus Scalindua sp.]